MNFERWFLAGIGIMVVVFGIAIAIVFSEHDENLCAAHGGHIYSPGRDTLCLTKDNRIIEDWSQPPVSKPCHADPAYGGACR